MSPDGYNIREGGNSGGGLRESTKIKMREKALLRNKDPDFRAKMKIVYQKRNNNSEWKEKLRQSRLGHIPTVKQLEALKIGHLLHKNNPELRVKKGEENGRAVLNTESVKQIRQMYATKAFTQIELARKFGVGQTAIGDIIRREKWKHVE